MGLAGRRACPSCQQEGQTGDTQARADENARDQGCAAPAGPGRAVLGRPGKKSAGPRGEGGLGRPGLGLGWVAIWVLGWFGFFFFFSLSYFKHHSNLFEFKHNFEFKPYALNQNKTMLQHECTNMLAIK